MNLWVDLRHIPLKKRLPLLREAGKHDIPILVAPGDADAKRKEAYTIDGARVTQGDKQVATWITIASGSDQGKANATAGAIVVEAKDWTIIPLENLIAGRKHRPDTLYAYATSPNEAKLFLDVLETGVHGIVLRADSAKEIGAVAKAMNERPTVKAAIHASAPVSLTRARITGIQEAGMADRACIDTTTQFSPRHGFLVGSTATSLALLDAETRENEYITARPFRVNAGALHAYILATDGKTKYLSEVRAGDRLQAIGPDGAHAVTVGRNKIERRPHVLVTWKGTHEGSMIVQWAETVRFVTPDGSTPVTDLAVGEEILVSEQTGGRHFGMPIDAEVREQ